MSDFVVIGGGIAGLSAAAAIAPLGHVTVLEGEDHLGYHASGRSAAMFEETYGKPSTIALNQASKDYHLTEGGSQHLPRGLILLGTEQTQDAFNADLVAMKMREIGIDEARKMIPVLDPSAVSHTGYHAEAWDIDTDAMLQRYARTVRNAGGAVHLKTRVTAIERGVSGWQIETNTGESFKAKLLINAAGAWADTIAQMAGIAPIGLQPLRRSMARVGAPEGHEVSNWPMIFGPGETWYAKPDAGALLISPADETLAEPHDAYADDMDLAEGIARYEAHVTTPVTRMLANWAGLRSFAPDRQLVIGAAPEDDGFFWCAGQGGYGFQTAPAASKLVGDLIAGRAPEFDGALLDMLSPARAALGH